MWNRYPYTSWKLEIAGRYSKSEMWNSYCLGVLWRPLIRKAASHVRAAVTAESLMDNWIGRSVLIFFFFCLLIACCGSWCLFSVLLMFHSHDFWVMLRVASFVFKVYTPFSVAGRESIAWRYLNDSMEQDTFLFFDVWNIRDNFFSLLFRWHEKIVSFLWSGEICTGFL